MRVPTSCTHTETTHEHGTLAAHQLDRCRCWPCTYAHRDYARDRARQIKAGTWTPFIDAEPTRAHIRALMAAGISYRDVASRAGLDRSTTERILYGTRPKWSPQKRIRPETAEKILAVQVTG